MVMSPFFKLIILSIALPGASYGSNDSCNASVNSDQVPRSRYSPWFDSLRY